MFGTLACKTEMLPQGTVGWRPHTHTHTRGKWTSNIQCTNTLKILLCCKWCFDTVCAKMNNWSWPFLQNKNDKNPPHPMVSVSSQNHDFTCNFHLSAHITTAQVAHHWLLKRKYCTKCTPVHFKNWNTFLHLHELRVIVYFYYTLYVRVQNFITHILDNSDQQAQFHSVLIHNSAWQR